MAQTDAVSTTASKPPKGSASPRDQFVERMVSLYGDLLYDLCSSVLISQNNAQVAFRKILRRVRSEHSKSNYVDFERAWLLKIAHHVLLPMTHRYGVSLSPSERLMLDASLKTSQRLAHFDSYFHRLTAEDQILLLLRDKYGFSYPEIASAMGEPEASLRLRRTQAFQSLEEWIWEGAE